jgi:hypothetical protein
VFNDCRGEGREVFDVVVVDDVGAREPNAVCGRLISSLPFSPVVVVVLDFEGG